MFNAIQPYRLVQRNRNRTGLGSWRFEWIYKFFLHSPSSRRKYLVEVRAYDGHLYTVDFYAKVQNVNRYRLRTHQHAAGKLGATVLDIIARTIRHDPEACFGFVAAAMLDETSDENTKRFRLYKAMLEQKIDPQRYTVDTIPEQSSIFVLPLNKARQPAVCQAIIDAYEIIFQENF
ncbi:hypothetical protein SAMN02745146_0807 [Hymenobacter daecheongensis DSM 21074]|uniref:Uncharacterized protein n=1 Tax=Hymenobacter daecheongensis DSM 21074 TaxID=1121955 RepID=A0A1M6AY22_9BACT|nr:hypothetical protein [Hymenobacter daecheongensis]SHI41346.1 hypothetical protein SAMN02745146_0807 [Hymenobacter daecheongensis DSM 21074]